MFKLRWIRTGLGVLALIGVATVATDQFSAFKIRRLESRITELDREKAELQLYAERLGGSRRVAQVNIVEQYHDDDGEPITILHWQQIGPSGVVGPRERLELHGDQVYFEALVIKFEHDLVAHAEPDHETSLAMFRRAFGDRQAPRTGLPLDQTAPPETEDELNLDSLQSRLWKRFWGLIDDPELAARYGVRIAQCEAPSVRVRPGQIWEVTLDAAGGLNLQKIAERTPTETARRNPAPLPGP